MIGLFLGPHSVYDDHAPATSGAPAVRCLCEWRQNLGCHAVQLRGAVFNSQSDDSVVVGCPSFPPGVLCESEPLLARNSSSKESASASSTSSLAAVAVSGDSVWFWGLGVGLSVCIVIGGESWLNDNSSLSHVLAASIVVGERPWSS